MSEIVQRRNIDFLLYEVLDIKRLFDENASASYDRETLSAILDTAQQLAEQKYLPLAADMDANEPEFVDGKVRMDARVAEALQAYAEAGFAGMSFAEEDGGLQLPYVLNLMVLSMFCSANIGLINYSFLTAANAHVISAFGTQDQKARYLAPMLEGKWFGTMCLSEPQAGSSLSDITTKAEPGEDGRYRLSGSKMWISGGDHELSDNIVHLVLAKIPGGAPGVKGISLFVVPRYRVNADGEKGEWNNVALAGLNHKMGQRGTVNCLLNFGEQGECIGEIVGEPGQGLLYMFQMMNEARIIVGLGAASTGLAGYLHSLRYAKERSQGRHPRNKDPRSPQVPIIEHADVKRMLLAQKASVEGAMALVAFAGSLVDAQRTVGDEAERAEIGLLLELLTPVVKSWPSEHCLEANKLAIQILGGYGYTREFPVERFYRDNRLNHIHEGTYAIHGIDLLGRKVRMQDGAALSLFSNRVRQTIAEAHANGGLGREADMLEAALDRLLNVTAKVVACDDLNLGLSLATVYLDAFGHIVIAWLWLRQAVIAARARENATGDEAAFYEGKLATCRYFFRHELPKVHAQLEPVGSLDDTCVTFQTEQFG